MIELKDFLNVMSNTPSRSGRPSSGLICAARRRSGAPARTTLLALAVALTVIIVPSITSFPSSALADPAEPSDPAAHFEALMAPTDPVGPPLATGEGAESATTGQAIVDFAMQYYGAPYVYAGNTPAGFDCSGFTQFVVQNVTGLDIGHGTEGQLAYGTPVAYADLQPGDLVYFAGTWGPGISHTGIYIGDGQIIHAENETTGVTISNLWGGYDAYYYSAIRIG